MNITATTIIGLAVRHGLTFVAGATGIEGLASGDTVQTATAVATGAIALGWSIYQKVRAARK